MEEKSQNPLTKIALVALTALSGTFGYLWMSEKNTGKIKDEEIQVKAEELASAKIRIDSIGVQLDQKIQEITALGGQVEELEAAKAELMKDKAALKKNGVNVTKDFQSKMSNYEALLAQKDQEIIKLKEENGILLAKNETLNSENTNLKGENTTLKTDVETKGKAIEETSAKNKVLSEKVAIAAALKAEGVVVNAIADNGKERDGGKYRAGKVSKLKVMFTLPANPLTEQENKTVYLRVLGPDGAVLADNATGSGTLEFLGKELQYTASSQVMYTNNGQMASILWGKGNTEWKDGNYSVELYSEGFKIGNGQFNIK
jgi:hypothetical protein